MVAGTNNDAFKVVQNLPGVARSPFGGGLLVVRGSKAWDSRVYVDEVQIPQLFHFAGVVATFNSANIEAIAFQPGNFGVDYGRSIGGLITADAKTPSKTGVHGFVDVNVFDVSAMVEAPVSDTWSVSGSARYGLAQFVLPAALRAFAPSASIGFGLRARVLGLPAARRAQGGQLEEPALRRGLRLLRQLGLPQPEPAPRPRRRGQPGLGRHLEPLQPPRLRARPAAERPPHLHLPQLGGLRRELAVQHRAGDLLQEHAGAHPAARAVPLRRARGEAGAQRRPRRPHHAHRLRRAAAAPLPAEPVPRPLRHPPPRRRDGARRVHRARPLRGRDLDAGGVAAGARRPAHGR
ncbi:MAG: Plug domain-containing protein [Myxococcaceae bacterium]|nr:Plug domain-containing protein [Myxococcaceae bacterium]MCA3011860.1 Plug domain-containing protein [Myxococcaceae bacterium]